MSKEKLSSQEIIDIVASKASVSKRASEEFLKVMISTIEEALLAGDSVKIKNLGTFKLHWNEPRKSVNVKTGEDIVLDGYYKVNFTPDSVLRDRVNEPFAHLEAFLLDADTEEAVRKDQPEPMDPLRTLNEQATEIKDILAEIMGVQPEKQKPAEKEETPEILPLPELQSDDEIPHQAHEEQISEPEITNTIEAEVTVSEQILNEVPLREPESVEVPAEPVIIEQTVPQEEKAATVDSSPAFIPKKKKSKAWLWILLAVIVVGAGGTGLYFSWQPARNVMNITGNALSEAGSGVVNTVSGWFKAKPQKTVEPVTVVIPKDTMAIDTVAEEDIPPVVVDTLQMLFDNPRTYSEIIATETIRAGSRLTAMARKYYGSKDFWVYIYEANREKINDPEKIASGTLIYIPKLDSRLIDKDNPRCIEKATQLNELYAHKSDIQE